MHSIYFISSFKEYAWTGASVLDSSYSQDILHSEDIAVSNGSYRKGVRTAAWVIQGKERITSITVKLIVPGTKDIQSAYHSELAGLHAIMSTVESVAKQMDLTHGSIEIGCDGFSAIKAILRNSQFTFDTSTFDIIAAIHSIMWTSSTVWTFCHIDSLQDKHKAWVGLDKWEQLNIEMDKMAQDHLHLAQRAMTCQMVDGKPWSLWNRNSKLINNVS